VENVRLSHIARTLQKGLLPGRLPHMPGWRMATLYRPAGDENWVGGDFYDAFAVRGGWLVLVGDVGGRGAEAAARTGLAQHTLRTAAQLLDDPLDAIGTLNAELHAREQMSLCSVAAVLLREEDVGVEAPTTVDRPQGGRPSAAPIGVVTVQAASAARPALATVLCRVAPADGERSVDEVDRLVPSRSRVSIVRWVAPQRTDPAYLEVLRASMTDRCHGSVPNRHVGAPLTVDRP
jgi:hypothetical protein